FSQKVSPFCSRHDIFNQGEIEHRLSPLELNLNGWGRCAKSEVESLFGHRFSHVKSPLVLTDLGNLAVGAMMVAPKGYNEHEEASEPGHSRSASTVFGRNKIDGTP